MATRDHVAALYQSPLASDLGISHLSMTLAYRRRVEKAAKYITSEDGKDVRTNAQFQAASLVFLLEVVIKIRHESEFIICFSAFFLIIFNVVIYC